jgi:CHASE3 domain sensor protein
LALPAVVVFVLAIILGVQVERRVDYQQWVEHSEQVLAKLSDAEKEILDQETGLRAFLLTGDEKFLDAYRRSRPPVLIDELDGLIGDNASAQGRVREIRQRYETWRSSRAALIVTHPERARLAASVMEGKQVVDHLRAAISALRAAETDLRRDRVEASRASLLATRIAFVMLFLLAAGILAVVSRNQLAAVAGFYRARRIGKGTVGSWWRGSTGGTLVGRADHRPAGRADVAGAGGVRGRRRRRVVPS